MSFSHLNRLSKYSLMLDTIIAYTKYSSHFNISAQTDVGTMMFLHQGHYVKPYGINCYHCVLRTLNKLLVFEIHSSNMYNEYLEAIKKNQIAVWVGTRKHS